MSIAIAIGWGIALLLCATSLWIRWRRRGRNPFTTRSSAIVNPPKMAIMPNAGDVLVYVNEDGSVRELTAAEKKYVDTEFSPLDGARPYLKSRYLDRTAIGIQGYLPRAQVPDGPSSQRRPKTRRNRKHRKRSQIRWWNWSASTAEAKGLRRLFSRLTIKNPGGAPGVFMRERRAQNL
jgi:hypothetical protein